jgi:uncharacterized membrane protein
VIERGILADEIGYPLWRAHLSLIIVDKARYSFFAAGALSNFLKVLSSVVFCFVERAQVALAISSAAVARCTADLS